jgi:hypothetical protein
MNGFLKLICFRYHFFASGYTYLSLLYNYSDALNEIIREVNKKMSFVLNFSRFEVPSTVEDTKKRVIQLRVLNVFKHWTGKYISDFDDESAQILENFLKEKVTLDVDQALKAGILKRMDPANRRQSGPKFTLKLPEGKVLNFHVKLLIILG